MGDKIKDRYDDMGGPALAAELADRELAISGKVDELRDRLRAHDAERAAQEDADGPDEVVEGEETGDEVVELPEPREPVEYAAGRLVLTEEQASLLTRGEAKIRAFVKHVNPMSERKYVEGDSVVAVLDHTARLALVLPFGIEIPLPEED